MSTRRRCDDHAWPTVTPRPLRTDGHHETFDDDTWAHVDELNTRGVSWQRRPALGLWQHVARLTRRRLVVHRDRIGLAVNVRPNGRDSWAGLHVDDDGWLVWLVDGKLAASWHKDGDA